MPVPGSSSSLGGAAEAGPNWRHRRGHRPPCCCHLHPPSSSRAGYLQAPQHSCSLPYGWRCGTPKRGRSGGLGGATEAGPNERRHRHRWVASSPPAGARLPCRQASNPQTDFRSVFSDPENPRDQQDRAKQGSTGVQTYRSERRVDLAWKVYPLLLSGCSGGTALLPSRLSSKAVVSCC
jgi:hypothetical protein